jgi:hypothetical protein
MLADGSWTGNKLIAVDLIQLFVSKSFWHSHYRKFFPKVSNHPFLLEWLENSSQDRPSNMDVWGFEKSNYNFKDLEAYLEQNGKKGKGKKTVKEKDVGGSKKKKDDTGKKTGNKMQVN